MIKIAIATARSADSRQWKNGVLAWPEFVRRLREPIYTRETFAEFTAMSKPDRGRCKDVGGYVCGHLNGGRRSKDAVLSRSALTLDLDYAPYDLWETLTMLWEHAMVLHSTHSHSPETPRYRLIVPLDREVTPDEYVAVARRFAASIGIEYFDPTTFDVNRLMFWPSVAKDGEYVFEEQDGAPLRVDSVLAGYRDWRDMSEWAFSSKVAERIHAERAKKRDDPRAKNNIVGYFCSAYSIHEAIEEFLPEVYTHAGGDRYTYALGSAFAGVVTYDGLHSFSHHGTDPASEELCNAFDLVRIHKFGAGDTGEAGTKSYKAMSAFCRQLGRVKKEIARVITHDFDEFAAAPAGASDRPRESAPPRRKRPANAAGGIASTAVAEAVADWREELEIGKNDRYESSARNIALILRNDERLAGRLRFNRYASKEVVTEPFPWHVEGAPYPRALCDTDLSGLRSYVEQVYGISAPQKLDDAVALELLRRSYDPVQDYFNDIVWDGVPRIDTLLTDCFNAEDSAYTREVSRKWLVAAVARAMTPGCKYDTVITLVGEEGTRKSSFFKKLGLDWFTDSFVSLEGNKPIEAIQGRLITEVAELSAFDKAETTQIKHFVTIQTDICRLAYARKPMESPRRGVIVATANNRTFLRDAVGNRRFWPIDVRLVAKTAGRIDVMSEEFEELIPQIWAEAVAMWRLGESLLLSSEAEAGADAARAGHVEVDDRRGIVELYLDADLPEGWDSMAPEVRADYLASPEAYGGKGAGPTHKRQSVCVAEVWCECFGKRREDLNRRMGNEVAAILRSIAGWEQTGKASRFGVYGVQKGYERAG